MHSTSGTIAWNVYNSSNSLVATYGPSAPVTNSDGQQSLVVLVNLPAGNYHVTATYSGDPVFAPSTSTNTQPLQVSDDVDLVAPAEPATSPTR